MLRKQAFFSILIISVLSLIQCQNKSESASSQAPKVEEAEEVNIETATPEKSVPVEDAALNRDAKEETEIDHNKSQEEIIEENEFVLDIDQTYLPIVEGCVYIRTAPNLEDSTIIQCLIPERREYFVSGMSHHLKPTGNTEGDWAEFEYWFDIYTMKPEPQDSINYDTWLMKRDSAHSAAKKKYRTFRKKGWLKYRNNDGSSKIKIVDGG